MRICLAGSLVFLLACSDRSLSTDSSAGSESETGSSDESETGPSDESETGPSDESETGPSDESETGDELESCTCVEDEDPFMCTDAILNDCDLPNPCGVLDLYEPDAEVATCVLQLLIDQAQPSRFDYYGTEDFGFSFISGPFYILGPGTGIDVKCDTIDLSAQLTATTHAINEPTYFQDCLGETASVMTECIFNGLTAMEPVSNCGGG